MFLTRSEYDRGVNTFSPEGRLFQVEYAIEAIKLGTTAIGIQTADGVILAVEKRLSSPLLYPESIEKVLEIDSHLGCAMSGLVGDAKMMVDHARVQAQNHWFTYDEPLRVCSCAQSVCDLALKFGEGDDDERGMSRPFGVALLLAGIDPVDGPIMYHLDPSGTYVKYEACAIGAGSEGAMSTLQDKYYRSMSFADAENLAVEILTDVMEEKVTKTNIGVAGVTAEKKWHVYDENEVQSVIDRLKKPAPEEEDA